MKTRNGKIARLPKPIREQLNQRLENGEPGNSLVTWLNQLPEVQKIITEQFAGLPIRPQNLSEWRKGGYLDWTRHQLLREQTRWTAEHADELGLDTTGASISIAEDIATVMSAELAIHVQTMGAIRNSNERFRQFCRLSRELSRLRRDDQRAIRTQLRHPQLRPTLRREADTRTGISPVSSSPKEPVPNPAEPPETPTSLSAGGAGVPASRTPIKTNAHEHIEIAAASECGTSERQRTGALQDAPRNSEASATRVSLPECGSPLPLSQSETKPANLIPKPEAITNSAPDSAPENVPYNPPLPAIPLLRPSDPIQVDPGKDYYDPRPPIRGRRFVCIEG